MFGFLNRGNKPNKPIEKKAAPKKQPVDWRESHAHLNLLSWFVKPRQANDLDKFQKWTEPLGEPVEVAIKRFLDLKLIIRADLIEHLLIRFSGQQLRAILVNRGLPVSGSKAAMAKRLIENDARGTSKLVDELFLLVCSERGKELAQAYLEYEERRRQDAIRQCEIALREARYRDAALARVRYDAESVFPGGECRAIPGESNYWGRCDTSKDEQALGYIFSKTPKLLVKKGWDQLPDLRIVSGLKHLWGTIEGTPEGSGIELNTAANMLWYHAKFLIEMEEYRWAGFKYVKVSTCNDDEVCGPCKKLAKARIRIEDMPELPNEYCKDELGCRCSVGVAVDQASLRSAFQSPGKPKAS